MIINIEFDYKFKIKSQNKAKVHTAKILKLKNYEFVYKMTYKLVVIKDLLNYTFLNRNSFKIKSI